MQSPHLVVGLVVCAGGVRGLDFAYTTQEIAVFERYVDFIGEGDAYNAAMMNVRI